MSNRHSLVLGTLVWLAVVVDLTMFPTGAPLFLAAKLVNLVEYLTFWR